LTETGVDATAFETFVRGDLFRAILRTQHADLFAGTTVGTGTVPTGTITPYAGTLAPESWLLCSGQAVLRSQYPDLYAVISNRFGGVTDGTTFRLPDLRDRVPVGAGDSYSLSATGGVSEVTLDTSQIPSHTHRLAVDYMYLGTGADSFRLSDASTSLKQGVETYTDPSGGGLPHTNMQPYVVLNYIIRT
jgi:microcystin-dependent protein